MLSLSIRYFFTIIGSLYIYSRILNLKYKTQIHFLLNLLFSACVSFIVCNFAKGYSLLRFSFLFVIYYIFVTLYTHTKPHISAMATIISFTISFVILAISSLLLSIIVTTLFPSFSPTSTLTILIMGLLQSFLIYLLFKVKRLRNGMPFLYKNSVINIGLALSLFYILLFMTLVQNPPTSFLTQLSLFLFIVSMTLALLIWWRRKITQSYVEKLRVSEVEALYKEISDKEHEIEKLHSNNRYLARIIHKDNKLIPAMELAVRNYLQNGMQMKPEDARQYGIDLLAQLQTMAADREGIIQNYHDDYRFRPQIGLYSVDAIIYYMERRAIPHSIRYEYQFDKGLKEVMLSYIDENDAIHLLSDAIENSIIATMHAIKKEIKIHIGFIQDILFMDISDTGLPFEPATYQNFGLLQHTTHKDSGGSGVGLLDIWKLKHKYKISLQIYEYPPDDHEYTKKIRFFFDRRNHFLIQSYRSQEITSLITRSDLHVFPYVEGSDFILTLDEEITEEAE